MLDGAELSSVSRAADGRVVGPQRKGHSETLMRKTHKVICPIFSVK
jgi:hypothetical protein